MVFDILQLKRIRKMMDLTQYQLAQKIGISQSMIAKIEAGKLDPTYSYVKKIESALNTITKDNENEAKDIMIRKIISVKQDDKVSHAVKLMNKYNISQLPVLQNERVIGLVTESSILENDLKQIGNQYVKDIITEAPPLVSQNTKISVIGSLLKHFPIILVADKGKIIGLIAKSDLLKTIV